MSLVLEGMHENGGVNSPLRKGSIVKGKHSVKIRNGFTWWTCWVLSNRSAIRCLWC